MSDAANNSTTWIAMGVTALFVIAGIGVVVQGTSEADSPEPGQAKPEAEQTDDATTRNPAPPEKKTLKGLRDVPEKPHAVPDGGYQKTDSGLEYFVIAQGSGEPPIKGAVVEMEYTGWLTDGTPFDSSYKRKGPHRFAAGTGQVITGWDEAVLDMKPGEKRQLRIPPLLAYGSRGRGRIPADATLVFDVELIKVEAPRVAPDKPQTVAESDYTVTSTGLKYHDFQVGTGASPTKGKPVRVDYTGWLTDGTRFDSSLTRNDPISFAIGRREVIPGWDEGVMSMKVGGKRQLYIPWKLAYGERGRPPIIPPKSDLIFEVELVDVQ